MDWIFPRAATFFMVFSVGCALSHQADAPPPDATPRPDGGADTAPACPDGECDAGCLDDTCIAVDPCATTRDVPCVEVGSYLKASNTFGVAMGPSATGDMFGTSSSVSGDTIAIGALREASGARGVDGDERDDSRPESGAVYVFRRSGTTWVQEAYLKASNTDASDQFGTSVSLDGDTLVVGATGEDSAARMFDGNQADNSSRDSGAAYVFRRTGTRWRQVAYLKPGRAALDSWFGASVSVDADTIAVGSRFARVDMRGGAFSTWAGAVHVFRRGGSTWMEEAYLEASNPGARHFFGAHLSLSADTLAVGATGESSAATGVDGEQSDDSALESGAVYVFRRSGTAWSQEAYLKASNTDALDSFGMGVGLDGDTLAVGAGGERSRATGVGGDQRDDSAENAGAVYVFRRSGTTWTQDAYLKASNAASGDWFGWSLSLSGDTLAVGAQGEASASLGVGGAEEDDSAPGAGAVYLFRRTEGAWSQLAYVKAPNARTGSRFGESVALTHDTLVVGASFEPSAARGVNGDMADESAPLSGAAYTFRIAR